MSFNEVDLARLSDPMRTLEPARGLVVSESLQSEQTAREVVDETPLGVVSTHYLAERFE